jgi:hypothetical protein
MKKHYVLYVIFVFLFLFGDIISTQTFLERKESGATNIIPDTCRCDCNLPPECDASPVIKETGSAVSNLAIYGKILATLLVGVFVWYDVKKKKTQTYFMLVSFDAMLIWVVITNFALSFWNISFIFVGLSFLMVHYFLIYFTRLPEDVENG